MNNIMILNLQNPIKYAKSNNNLDTIISNISKEEVGFEALCEFNINYLDDYYNLEFKASGIGHLKNGAKESNSYLTLNEGKYYFLQLPLLDNTENLSSAFLPLAYKSKSTTLFVRIVKESILEFVIQLLLPC